MDRQRIVVVVGRKRGSRRKVGGMGLCGRKGVYAQTMLGQVHECRRRRGLETYFAEVKTGVLRHLIGVVGQCKAQIESEFLRLIADRTGFLQIPSDQAESCRILQSRFSLGLLLSCLHWQSSESACISLKVALTLCTRFSRQDVVKRFWKEAYNSLTLWH